MTRLTLADAVGAHVTQLRRYEAGTTQPTLEVRRALAVALAVSADDMVFDPDEHRSRPSATSPNMPAGTAAASWPSTLPARSTDSLSMELDSLSERRVNWRSRGPSGRSC